MGRRCMPAQLGDLRGDSVCQTALLASDSLARNVIEQILGRSKRSSPCARMGWWAQPAESDQDRLTRSAQCRVRLRRAEGPESITRLHRPAAALRQELLKTVGIDGVKIGEKDNRKLRLGAEALDDLEGSGDCHSRRERSV